MRKAHDNAVEGSVVSRVRSSLHNLGFVSGRGFSRAESLSQENMAFRPLGEFEGLAEFVSEFLTHHTNAPIRFDGARGIFRRILTRLRELLWRGMGSAEL